MHLARCDRSLPAVMPRAQEGGDAVCAYEAHSQTRQASPARPERREGRGAVDRHGAELEASGQAHVPKPTANYPVHGVVHVASGVGDRTLTAAPEAAAASRTPLNHSLSMTGALSCGRSGE